MVKIFYAVGWRLVAIALFAVTMWFLGTHIPTQSLLH
jgi:hypothetical protein